MLLIVSKVLLSLGVVSLFIGSVGVNRLPDFYSRAHAASKPDTLGLILCMVGLALYDGFNLNSAKLLLVVLFVALGNPAATHALGRAALSSGLLPWTRTGLTARRGGADQRGDTDER